MKMGTILSRCPYDVGAQHALQSVNVRCPTISLYASWERFLPNLKQDIVFCFDWFEVGLLAEHDPHLYLNSPRNK